MRAAGQVAIDVMDGAELLAGLKALLALQRIDELPEGIGEDLLQLTLDLSREISVTYARGARRTDGRDTVVARVTPLKGGRLERLLAFARAMQTAQPPQTWECGWLAKSNRCMRFDCHKSGPCGGFAK